VENGYSYFLNLLLALDQLLNAIMGGSCDETLSSRTYRMACIERQRKWPGKWCKFEKLINTLFYKDRGPLGQYHCQLAYDVEMKHGHMPKAMTLQSLKI